MNSKENQFFGRETDSTFRSAFSPEKSGTPAGKSGTHQFHHKIFKNGAEKTVHVSPVLGWLGGLGWAAWAGLAGCAKPAATLAPPQSNQTEK